MIIGRLDRKVLFQRKSTTLNDTGNETESYTDLCYKWVQFQPFRGKENTESGQTVASNFYVWKCRYDSRLKPKDRAYYQGDYFEIVSVAPLGRREALELFVQWKDNTQ